MKAVIIEDERAIGGKLLENAEFIRFAVHWNFRIRACRPYRAKTKGKVERPIGYVGESFFYGRHFLNDADLNAQAHSWLERTANVRAHRTTAEAPQLRFERDERGMLKPLAPRRYRSLILATKPTPSQASYPALSGVRWLRTTIARAAR